MANQYAPVDCLYICLACGKCSHDRYGEKPVSKGWDESCMMYSACFKVSDIEERSASGERIVRMRDGAAVLEGTEGEG